MKTNYRLHWNMFKARRLRRLWHWLNAHFPARCGYACEYVYPYGWTVEAGCPVHDDDA